MNFERDKFLTEAMDICWHENLGFARDSIWSSLLFCGKCNTEYSECHNLDFNTWDGFGKLWEWAEKQEWWNEFCDKELTRGGRNLVFILNNTVNPDKFANAVYDYLKSKNNCLLLLDFSL